MPGIPWTPPPCCSSSSKAFGRPSKRRWSRSGRRARSPARASSASPARGGARTPLEGPQERFRRRGPGQPDVLRAGWRRAPDQDRADPALHRRGRRKYGLTISNIFHAGDGNMHPIILFNPRKPGDMEKARAAGDEILTYCIDAGGSITGEHGVGMEKKELMAKLFSAETLDTIRRLKLLFDPDDRLNPGKVLPTGRGCLEIRQAPLRLAVWSI